MSAQPVGLFGDGQRVAAVQHRPDREVDQIARRRQRGAIDLGHLPDLLVQRHLRQQRGDVGADGPALTGAGGGAAGGGCG